MAELTIKEKPRITDTIRFQISTPDGNGCFLANPYKIDKITIYHVERNFLGSNYGEYEEVIDDDESLAALAEAQAEACVFPTEENIRTAERLADELESKSQRNSIFFKEAVPVFTLGTELDPAWLSSVPNESSLDFAEDENGDPLIGQFEFIWNPQESAAREGNYFICWTWTPLVAGESLSAHLPFFIHGDSRAVTALPTHHTPNDKYETLLERYLPEMYKTLICDGDLTPRTLDRFNKSVAEGFTFTEDLANQIIDLLDANVLHESLLVFLGNSFNLKLKSMDPTLWRRQIKRAIPVFKKKGTEEGLKEAFAQAGMILSKVTRYWQIVSKYTYKESFRVEDSPTFKLTKESVVPVNDDNFGLWIRRAGSDVYEEQTLDNIEFSVNDETCEVFITWVGDEKSVGAIQLYEGDILLILYQFSEIPNETEQQLEYYVRNLSLMDQRDEALQEYPPKNWNVHLIEEDDTLFDILVPVRHPFADPIVFGKIRTEFPYSENIYNMEEYNGSIRDSYEVCHIGKEFIDPCGACKSSKFSVDIGIEELSNNRILEAQDILNEYKPFHAVVHTINFGGEVEEAILPPVETIEALITYTHTDNILPGNANPIFHRVMEDGLTISAIYRDDLADQNTVLSGESGTAYHDEVTFVSINLELESLGVIEGGSSLLEVLAPSANAGTYNLVNVEGQMARVSSSVTEPVNTSLFTFNLKNILFGSASANIVQKDVFKFSDENVDFAALGVKSSWDILNTPDYTGGAWKVEIPTFGSTYDVENVLPGGILLLTDDGSLPTTDTTDIEYILLDDNDNEIDTGEDGVLDVTRQATVDLNASELTESNIRQFFNVGDYLLYDGTEYEIVGLDGTDVLIGSYDSGDVASANVEIRRLLADGRHGQFGYRGLRLATSTDLESTLGIVNGANPPAGDISDNSKFKENYLISIDGEFFRIEYIDGTNLVLGGPEQTWPTLSAGGESVSFDVIHLDKTGVEIKFDVFDHLDRDGQDVIERRIESTVDDTVAVTILSTPGGGSSIVESVNQEESVSFTIEYSDGTVEEGEL